MRLSSKLLALVGTISIIGFGSLVWVLVEHETTALIDAHRGKNDAVARSVVTGIQNIMLTGEEAFAEELVADTRNKTDVSRLRVYNHEAVEVYLPREKRMGGTDDLARQAMADGAEIENERHLVRPLRNEKGCHRCHESEDDWRGAVSVELKNMSPGRVFFGFVDTALKNVMLSGEADEVDGFLTAMRSHSVIDGISITGLDGEAIFGTSSDWPDDIKSTVQRVLKDGGQSKLGATFVAAIENEARCHVCHGEEDKYRGTVVLAFSPVPESRVLTVATTLFERSLMQLMMSDRGNELDGYLQELRRSPDIDEVQLFNGEGVEIYPQREEEKPKGEKSDNPRVLEALETGRPVGYEQGDTYTQLLPMPNEVRCQACHGSDHTVRGIVEIETDLKPVRQVVKATFKRASIIVILFIIVASLLLFVFIRSVLVRPVIAIGQVAQRVGEGDLDVSVEHRARDEVGDLAVSMNDMIMGLRSKGMMERFVGSHTRRMIDESVRGDMTHRAPVRRRIAVLFSDVRGFTSYSERREPEEVIATLNVYLGVQAEVIQSYGGYVDKFVGDEVMALFEGEDMERRAVQAAIAMRAAAAGVTGVDRMEIGIGINAGDVVFGSMGAAGRQDYTVIGDVVNLGARLCSAAGSGIILVSREVQEHTVEQVNYGPEQSLTVKGKEAPVRIYEVI